MKWEPEQIMLLILVSTIPFLFAIVVLGVLLTHNSTTEQALDFIEKYSLTIIALFAGMKIGQNSKNID